MAIAAFNTSSLEAVRVAIDAAEATGDPVPPPESMVETMVKFCGQSIHEMRF